MVVLDFDIGQFEDGCHLIEKLRRLLHDVSPRTDGAVPRP
jgi:hypothetical protein